MTDDKTLPEMNEEELREAIAQIMESATLVMNTTKHLSVALMLLAKKLDVDPVQLMADARTLSENTEALTSALGLTFVPAEEEE